MNFNLENSPINDILVLSGDSGLCIYHLNQSEQNVSEDLYSSFIAAIYSFSQEIGTKSLEKMSLGERELFITKKDKFLFVLDSNLPKEWLNEKTEAFCQTIMERFGNEFLNIMTPYLMTTYSISSLSENEIEKVNERLFPIISEVEKEFYAETVQDQFKKVEKFVSNLFGKSMGKSLIDNAKKESGLSNITTEENLNDVLNSIKLQLDKRVGKAQAPQIMDQINSLINTE